MSPSAQLDERWQLVAPHRERLLRLLRTRCSTHQDAEDCVHEALLRVATFPQLDEQRASQMLTVVALRLAVDQHRQPQRRRNALRRLFASTVARSPEDVAVDRLHAQHMLDQTEQLGAQERSVLLLRAQGVGAADVAVELGVSYKSAESAYTRARRKLRAAAAVTAAFAAAALRHILRGPSTTTAMAATAVALVALTAPGERVAGHAAGVVPHAHDERVERVSNGGAAATAPGAPAPRTVINLNARGLHARPAAPAASSAAPGGEAVQVVGVDVKNPGVSAPISVHRSNVDKSFTESVSDCLAHGVSVDPQRLGCHQSR